MQARHRFLTVGDVPRHYARLHHHRDRPAVIGDERSLTWADVDAAADGIAAALRASGLGPGAKVATLLPNCIEYVELMFGIARAGCVIVPLNSRYVAPEIAHGVDFSDAELLVTAPAFCDTVKSVLPLLPRVDENRVVVVGDGAPALGRSYANWRVAAGRPDGDVDPDSLYWMPFTSGTTGVAKAAMVSHQALMASWVTVLQEFDISRHDVELIAGPFYHSLGFLFGLSCLYAGGTIVIQSEFDPERVLTAIERHQVTLTPMVPTMYTMLLAAPELQRFDLSSMRKVVSAGSPLLTGTKEGLVSLFPNAGIYEMYGSTEMGMVSVLRPEDQLRKVRSVGQPVIGGEVRLLDGDGRDVGVGEAGEIHKRGQLLGAAYYKNDEATEAVYRGDWMASGDVGVFDDEGYLYIVDRKKDMIISGGANIFPSEIEEVMSRFPGVLEVAVVGLPDETWGEAVTAFVVPEPGATIDVEGLSAHCRNHLAGYKKPRSIEVVEALPKSGAGKILKRELRDRYWGADGPSV